MQRITLFIPVSSMAEINYWSQDGFTAEAKITLLLNNGMLINEAADLHLNEYVSLQPFTSWGEQKQLASLIQSVDTPYLLLCCKSVEVKIGYFGLQRMLQIADDTAAGLLYADRYLMKGETATAAPTIDYQIGSVRDDFDFGALMLIRTDMAIQALKETFEEYHFGALYNLRLKISQFATIQRIAELLYTEVQTDHRASGQKLFDYVDPKNRDRQIEMERICISHLKAIGAYLKPEFDTVDFGQWKFETEASVIIPVRNRAKTIADAIGSVLAQQTAFAFNLIVVDNHSTDGTTEIVRQYAEKDRRIVHITPSRTDLGIGGCWNKGIEDSRCGRFAIQLDSDDIYASTQSLQTIVDAFYREKTPMIVGTYQMTDFNLNAIPPGIIDHREWTPENGRNNALRINGLGAPRAFFTPLLRGLHLPNTSYGEDYAIGLRISRNYQIGRVYDVVYNCRRWDDNSDALLSLEKLNSYNSYKDKIRSWEIQARIRMNRGKN